MARGVIYVRVSSDEQVRGMSLDFQKQDCLAYAQKKGIEVGQIYEEKGESAKFADRPELIKLLDHCARRDARIDALIVWKLDRLSRNQLDYYYLKRKLLNLGIATPDPKLFPIIGAALREYAKGFSTQVDLVTMLDRQGLAAARGRKTHKQLVSKMLYAYLDFYRGWLFNPWGGEMVKGRHEPMISEVEYLRIVAIRDGRGACQHVKKRAFNPRFPLRRLVICPNCQQFYTASLSKGKRQRYAYYHCQTKGCLAYGKSIPCEKVEDQFVSLANRYSLSHEYLDRLKLKLDKAAKELGAETQAALHRTERHLVELLERRRRICEMCEDGSYSRAEFQERKTAVEHAINEVKLEQCQYRIQIPDAENVFAYARQFIARFGSHWEQMPPEVYPVFHKLLLPEGIVYNRERGYGTPKVGPIFGLYEAQAPEKSSVVPRRGLEPPPLARHDFESCASTNSATRALI